MPLSIVKQDITKIECDAIVNATNEYLLPGGDGVDAAIHSAAGPELLEECTRIGHVDTGKVVKTQAYKLPYKSIIHTAGPVWRGGEYGEEALLASSYLEALKIASDEGYSSIAFPLISSGSFGFPKDRVLKIATDTIVGFLETHELTVIIAIYDKSAFSIGYERKEELDRLLRVRRRYDCEPSYSRNGYYHSSVSAGVLESCAQAERLEPCSQSSVSKLPLSELTPAKSGKAPGAPKAARKKANAKREPLSMSGGSAAKAEAFIPDACYDVAEEKAQPATLEQIILDIDESFSEKLIRLIDLKGITDVACYKKANVSRQTWHKIISDSKYMPSKNTVISFAIALELTYEETQALLMSTGFVLSDSLKFDRIISFFLKTGNYSVSDIDAALFSYDLPTLYSYA